MALSLPGQPHTPEGPFSLSLAACVALSRGAAVAGEGGRDGGGWAQLARATGQRTNQEAERNKLASPVWRAGVQDQVTEATGAGASGVGIIQSASGFRGRHSLASLGFGHSTARQRPPPQGLSSPCPCVTSSVFYKDTATGVGPPSPVLAIWAKRNFQRPILSIWDCLERVFWGDKSAGPTPSLRVRVGLTWGQGQGRRTVASPAGALGEHPTPTATCCLGDMSSPLQSQINVSP